MKIHTMVNAAGQTLQYWYDNRVRCWFAMPVDGEGNQIGNAIDSYTKAGLLSCVGSLELYDF